MSTSAARSSSARRTRSSRTRARILRAARRLYFADGADGVSARKIARAVGLSPTALYLHFRSMGDLLHHLRMEGHARLAEYLTAVDPRLPALERVRAMGRAYHRFGLENRGYYELMFLVRAADRPPREAVQREMQTLMLLRDVVRAGMDGGGLRDDLDPMVVTTTLWAEVHGVTALAVAGLLVEPAPAEDAAVLEAVLDAVTAWLTPREARVP